MNLAGAFEKFKVELRQKAVVTNSLGSWTKSKEVDSEFLNYFQELNRQLAVLMEQGEVSFIRSVLKQIESNYIWGEGRGCYHNELVESGVVAQLINLIRGGHGGEVGPEVVGILNNVLVQWDSFYFELKQINFLEILFEKIRNLQFQSDFVCYFQFLQNFAIDHFANNRN